MWGDNGPNTALAQRSDPLCQPTKAARRHRPRIALSEVSLSPPRPHLVPQAHAVRPGPESSGPGGPEPWGASSLAWASGDPVRTFQGQGHALLPTLLLPQAQRGDLPLRCRGPRQLGEGRIQKTLFRPSLRSHPTQPCLPAMGCQCHRDKAALTEVGSVPSAPAWGMASARAGHRGQMERRR